MRVLTTSWYFPPFVGGTENIAYEAAIALTTRGHDITVLTSPKPGENDRVTDERVHGLRILRHPAMRTGNQTSTVAKDFEAFLSAQLTEGAFDIAYTHMLTYPLAPDRAMVLADYLNELDVPIVDTAHGGNYGRNASAALGMLRRIVLMICDSRAVAEHLARFAHANDATAILPPLKVVYPAIVDAKRFVPDIGRGTRERRRLGIPMSAFVVLFPSRFFDLDGSLSVAKRPLTAIRAFKELTMGSDRPCRLLAIMPPGFASRDAESESRRQVHNLLRTLKIEEEVLLLDRRVNHGEMADLFRVADIAIIPSLEGFGLVFLEAMSCGVPVVGVHWGAASEVVAICGGSLVEPPPHGNLVERTIDTEGPEDDALSVRLGAACAELLRNEAKRQALSISARQRALQFRAQDWIAQLDSILTYVADI